MQLQIKWKQCLKRGWGATAILILWCISYLEFPVFAEENHNFEPLHSWQNRESSVPTDINAPHYIRFPNPVIDEPDEAEFHTLRINYSPINSHQIPNPQTFLRRQSSDLVAYYPFNGNPLDESGNGNDGIAYGPTLVMDRFGNPTGAYSFDGVDDYIDLPNFATPRYTVSLWIKANEKGLLGGKTQTVTSGHLIDGWSDGEIFEIGYYQKFTSELREDYRGYTTPGNYLMGAFHPYKDGINKIQFREQRLFHSTNLADGAWHSLMISYDGSLASLYLDGKRVNSVVFDDSIATDINPIDEMTKLAIIDLGIGRSKRYNTYTIGVMDDIRFYNRALSDFEVQTLYYQESGLVAYYPFNGNSQDESGRGNHGIRHGATLVMDRFGNPQGALEFDGMDDDFELPNNSDFEFGEFLTISLWVKPTYKNTEDQDSPEVWMYPIKKATQEQGANWSWGIYFENYHEIYGVMLKASDGNLADLQGPYAEIPEDTFSHLAMTYNGQEFVLYLNGKIKQSVEFSGSINNPEDAKIVSQMINYWYYKGQLDDLRFYNRTLTAAEVQNLYIEESVAPKLPLNNVVQISNGYHHSCALLSNGTVKCWGNGTWGQLGNGSTNPTHVPELVEGISTATQISAGSWYTCALLKDQSVKCWGSGHYGQLGDGEDYRDFGYTTTPVNVVNLFGVVQISAGDYHTCAVLADETVKCWGRGNNGQLGSASTSSTTPVTIVGVSDVVQIATGKFHNCVLLKNGTIQCWGSGDLGQLGNGGEPEMSTTPILVEGITNAVQIAGKGHHACALLSDHTLRCWGRGTEGQLGISITNNAYRPIEISELNDVASVAPGLDHTCAYLHTGKIYCWGKGNYGQLGNGDTEPRYSPTLVQNISNANQISLGAYHTCARLQNGTAQCWGMQRNGRLGHGIKKEPNVPVIVYGIAKAHQISSGDYHNCATLSDGALACWGQNTYGQLGDGSQIAQQTPKSLSNLSNVLQTSAGKFHTCVLLSDQSVQCWGDGREGQLGNGKNENSSIPAEVQSVSDVYQLSSGNHHTCVLLNDRTVQCWGRGEDGQLGNGQGKNTNTPVTLSGLSNVRQIDSGEFHTCALLESATVHCWGRNVHGQLGNGSTDDSLAPIAINGLTNVKQVVAGDSHSCAVFGDGGVHCWGNNSFGQLGTGNQEASLTPTAVLGVSNVQQISTGNAHTCALLENGTVQCWGKWFNSDNENDFELITQPREIQGIAKATQLSSGRFHSCALLEKGSIRCWGLGSSGELGDGNAWSTIPSRVLFPQYEATITPAQDTTIIAGESVDFSANVIGGEGTLQYLWDLGGGATSVSIEDPGNIVFSEAGVYSVILTVEDQEGNITTDTRRITVVPDLSPTLVLDSPISDTVIDKEQSVHFAATGSGGNGDLTYHWDFEGGASSIEEDPGDIFFLIVGEYTVTVTVTDEDGDTDQKSVSVQVNPGIISSTHPNTKWFYNSDSITLDASVLSQEETTGYYYLVNQNPTANGISSTDWLSSAHFSENPIFTIPIDSVTEGTKYVHVIAFGENDVHGVAKSYKLNINQSPPSVSSSTHPDSTKAYSANHNVMLEWTTLPGLTYYYRLDQSPNTIPTETDSVGQAGNIRFPQLDLPSNSDDYISYYFHIVAQDASGNFSPASHFQINLCAYCHVAINLDSDVNVTSITNPNPDLWYNNPSPQFIMAGSSEGEYLYNITSSSRTLIQESRSYWLNGAQLHLPNSIFTFLKDGIHYLHLRAYQEGQLETGVQHFQFRMAGKTAFQISTSTDTEDPSLKNIKFTWRHPLMTETEQNQSFPKYYVVWDKAPNTEPTQTDRTISRNHAWFEVPAGGLYYLHIRSEDTEGALSKTTHFSINIGEEQPYGNLILVAGGGLHSDNKLREATQYLSNLAYQKFRDRSFTPEDIYYFNPAKEHDIDGDGQFDDIVDSSEMTIEALGRAIVDWAPHQKSSGPLYLYLNDHGGNNGFGISPGQNISASQLDTYLDSFQEATHRQVIVIIEACKSGTFQDELADPNRLIITSSDTNDSYVSPSGDISFSQPFFMQLFAGASFQDAFDYAVNVLKTYGRPYRNQVPTLQDGENWASLQLGNSSVPSNYLPEITAYTQSTSAIANIPTPLFVNVTALDQIKEVTAVITPSDFIQPSLSEDFSSPQFTLPVVSLVDVEDEQPLNGTYEGSYTFATNGRHQIVFTVRDQNNHVVSSPPIFIEVSDGTDAVIWQLVSFTQNLPLAPETFFGTDQKELIRSVWSWKNNRWKIWSPTHSIDQLNTLFGETQFEPLNQLEPGRGYWINSKAHLTFPIVESGSFFQDLQQGWNLVGFSKGQEGNVADYFEQHPNIASMWAWGSDGWQVHSRLLDYRNYRSLSQIQIGLGYWILVR